MVNAPTVIRTADLPATDQKLYCFNKWKPTHCNSTRNVRNIVILKDVRCSKDLCIRDLLQHATSLNPGKRKTRRKDVDRILCKVF
jgi:hypothetical protein